jgi:carboxyl-terminal processing protease
MMRMALKAGGIAALALVLLAGGAARADQPGALPGALPGAVPAAAGAAVGGFSVQQFAQEVWSRAKTNDLEGVLRLGQVIPAEAADPTVAELSRAFAQLKGNIAKRETERAEQSAKVRAKLGELLAKDREALTLSNALKEAVELHMLAAPGQKDAVLAEELVQMTIQQASIAARKAEEQGQWLLANELFGRLNLLLEERATFKADAKRLSDRLTMLRFYNPRRFYDLRNERQIMDGKKALPPYNGAGEDPFEKLRGITRAAIVQAIDRASDRHVERRKTTDMLAGGLMNVRTLLTTHDLDNVFPELKNEAALGRVLAAIDAKTAELKAATQQPGSAAVDVLLADLTNVTRLSLNVPDEAVLHEFGNGAFDKLDEFSEIIWPDQVARFRRMTMGSFIGVGVQIQLDEESQLIKVVQPLEGTPAQRAGIRAGDFIKKINEESAVGMSLDQAIEKITGRDGTPVRMTMEREGREVVFDLVRAKIPIRTAKGWKRTGPSDTDWDWFIDPANGIGYVRLSGFNDNTTRELHGAIRAMGPRLKGLILDLRFNPGGLLNEAVTVSNTFIADGNIVYTESAGGVREQTERADRDAQIVKGLPVIALINEGSASASEIVSGALRHYGRNNSIQAMVVGWRSFGKGSVQNVMPLRSRSDRPMEMKLTTQYYHLPGGELIHRREGATSWGVDPALAVEMLPQQTTDALTLRIDADTPPEGRIARKPAEGEKPLGEPEPDRLISEGFDLQLESAVLLLKTQSAAARLNVTLQPRTATGG